MQVLGLRIWSLTFKIQGLDVNSNGLGMHYFKAMKELGAGHIGDLLGFHVGFAASVCVY